MRVAVVETLLIVSHATSNGLTRQTNSSSGAWHRRRESMIVETEPTTSSLEREA